jgi:hypothetical protein
MIENFASLGRIIINALIILTVVWVIITLMDIGAIISGKKNIKSMLLNKLNGLLLVVIFLGCIFTYKFFEPYSLPLSPQMSDVTLEIVEMRGTLMVQLNLDDIKSLEEDLKDFAFRRTLLMDLTYQAEEGTYFLSFVNDENTFTYDLVLTETSVWLSNRETGVISQCLNENIYHRILNRLNLLWQEDQTL